LEQVCSALSSQLDDPWYLVGGIAESKFAEGVQIMMTKEHWLGLLAVAAALAIALIINNMLGISKIL
jgi:hypothetical protein